MRLPGFTAGAVLRERGTGRSDVFRTFRRRSFRGGAVRLALWSLDDRDDNGTDDSGDGFQGFGDSSNGGFEDTPSVIWPHAGCTWMCTIEGGQVHCVGPLTCIV